MAIPTGLPYFPDGMIVQDASTGAMSIIQGGDKRSLTPEVYRYLGNPPVSIISANEYSAIPNCLYYFGINTIVANPSAGAVSIIQGGLDRGTNGPNFQYLGNPQATLHSEAQYAAVPTGLQYFPNGMIVQDATTNGLSVIHGDVKRLLSPAVYLYFGNPPVTVITDAEYQAIPTGSQYFPDGMIVQDGPSGQISIVQGGLKELVGDGDPNPANNPVYLSMRSRRSLRSRTASTRGFPPA